MGKGASDSEGEGGHHTMSGNHRASRVLVMGVANDQLFAHRDISPVVLRIYRLPNPWAEHQPSGREDMQDAVALAFLQRQGLPGGLTMLRETDIASYARMFPLKN